MQLYKKIKEYLFYLWQIFKITFTSSFSISQNILSYFFILLYALLLLAHWLLPSVINKVPFLESIMDVNWWQASLMALGVIFCIRLLLAPYWIYRAKENELKKLKDENINQNITIKNMSDVAITYERELTELRRKQRKIEETRAHEIPTTLNSMHELVKKLIEEKSKNSYSNKELLDVFLEVLDLERTHPLLKGRNYSNPDRVGRTLNKFREHLGLTNGLIIKWSR